MKSLLQIIYLSALVSQNLLGEKINIEVQKDPIPIDQIPPSPFLEREEALKSFEVADGFVIENIAEENVHQPVCLSFDADGRAWVVEMVNYMIDFAASDENEPTGRIKVLEDTTGDGVLDKTTIFLDKLILPRAVAVTSDGLLYAHQDKLFFIKRGGDDGLTPLGETILVDAKYALGGNAEHKANGLLLGRDNWYYSAKSGFRYRRLNGKWVKQRTKFRGQWGIAQDDAGRLFHNKNSIFLVGESTRPNFYLNHPTYTPKYKQMIQVGKNNTYPIRITPGVNRAYQKGMLNESGKLARCTGAAGMAIYRGQNFPSKYYGTAFISESASNLIKAIKVDYTEDNSLKGSFPLKNKEFMASRDEWFRPVNIYTAPDGTLWVLDMYIGLIQHEVYLSAYLKRQYISRGLDKPKPNNGRIYRVRHLTGEIGEVPRMSHANMAQLQQYLNHSNGTLRDTAQRLIVERITSLTDTSDFNKWQELNKSPSYKGYGLLHALWIHEAVGAVPLNLIEQALGSNDTEVVNSALELAHYCKELDQSKLLNIQAQSKTAASYLFALGKIASLESHTKAVEIMSLFKAQFSQLEAAYVSGLGKNVKNVVALDTPVELTLSQIFDEAIKSENPKVVIAAKIPAKQQKRYDRGKALYLGAAACSGCHGLEGKGDNLLFPPIVGSEWVNGEPDVMTKVILHGLQGPIKVNGVSYKGMQAMPAYKDNQTLSNDEDLACLVTYIRYMKGNKGGVVTAEQIKKIRENTKDHQDSYTEKDLRPLIK